MIKNVIVQSRGIVKACFQPQNPDKGNFGFIFGPPFKTPPFALLSIVGHTEDSIGTDNPVPNWLSNHVDHGKLWKLNCLFFHQICFGDVTEKHDWKPDIFTEEQAHEVIDFITAVNKEDFASDLVIHCDAGISRSGAVGVFACRFLGLDENIVRNKRRIDPNPHVLGLLMEKSGLNAQRLKAFDSLPDEKDIVKASCREIAKMVAERTRTESKGNWIQQNFLGSVSRELEIIWPELIEFFKKNPHLINP